MENTQDPMDMKPEDVKKTGKPKRYYNPLYRAKFRNQPCMCGSGKKTKKCHGKNHEMNQAEYDELNEFHKKQFGVPMRSM